MILFCMMNSNVKSNTFNQLDLLKRVVRFKEKFYRCNWARYDEAIKGKSRLLPPEDVWNDLKEDYIHMQNMMYAGSPDFKVLMEYIEKLEQEIKEFDWS